MRKPVTVAAGHAATVCFRYVPLWSILVALLPACAAPAQRMGEQAAQMGYQSMVLPGAGYNHVVYTNFRQAADHSVLHVYLEGDGTPWLRRGLPSADPTPRNPMMLALMLHDARPSVLLGRPCYHGLSGVDGCTPDLWTSGRYSEAIVTSMAAALTRLVAAYESVVLIGYSGGGTLAILIAQRVQKAGSVVTLAANLDTSRWARLHNEDLSGSLNPAARASLPAHIRQLHIAGGQDENVPPALIREALAGQPGAKFRIFEAMDHGCCWQKIWPEVLASLDAI